MIKPEVVNCDVIHSSIRANIKKTYFSNDKNKNTKLKINIIYILRVD